MRPFLRAKSSGSSATAVSDPTRMPSLAARMRCTAARDCSPVIQRDSPLAVAMRPSSVLASFKLTKGAQPDTLVVYVDEVEVAQDATNGWTYDESTWFITFHGDAIPPRGSTVTAEYTVIPGADEPDAEIVE